MCRDWRTGVNFEGEISQSRICNSFYRKWHWRKGCSLM
jgi:hypothetical protein